MCAAVGEQKVFDRAVYVVCEVCYKKSLFALRTGAIEIAVEVSLCETNSANELQHKTFCGLKQTIASRSCGR